MAVYKTVWKLESLTAGATWSYVIYRQKDNLEEAANISDALIDALLKVHSTYTKLKKISISEVANPRVSTIKAVNKNGTQDGQPANPGETAVLTLASSAVPASRKLALRGLGEDIVRRPAGDGQWITGGELDRAMPDIFNELHGAAKGWVVLTKAKTLADGVRKAKVKKVEAGVGPGTIKVTCDQEVLVAQGQRVQISGVSPLLIPGLNGNYEVLIGAGVSFDINFPKVPPAPILVNQGTASRLLYKEGAFIDKNLCGFSHAHVRKTKSFSIGAAGRRRASLRKKDLV